MSDHNFSLGGGRGPSPMSYPERDSEKKEIRIQVPIRSGPDYVNLNAYIPSHLQKVCSLGADNSTVEASRRRLAENMAGQNMEWDKIKSYVQELYDRGKLAKWAGSLEAVQVELQKCFKYFNAATLSKE